MRHIRQTTLPQIGTNGQTTFFRASVLIAGARGLGSIFSYYLAVAGIGNLIKVIHLKIRPCKNGPWWMLLKRQNLPVSILQFWEIDDETAT